MKVFLSWHGQPSHELALALKRWLPKVNHHFVPWLSSTDIQPGSEWLRQLDQGLETTDFGILCITPGSQDSPWLLFEAGRLFKAVEGESRVCIALLDLEPGQLRGPLATLQASRADREGLEQIVGSLNAALPETERLQDMLLIEKAQDLWPNVQADLTKIRRRTVSTRRITDESAPDKATMSIHDDHVAARIAEHLQSATEQIDILQTYLPAVELIRKPLLTALNNGSHIRILVLKEESPYLMARLTDLRRDPQTGYNSLGILRSITLSMPTTTSGSFEVRGYDRIPHFPVYRIDGRLFVGFYLRDGSFSFGQIELQMDTLASRFPALLEHFETYWNDSNTVDLTRVWQVQETLKNADEGIAVTAGDCRRVQRDASVFEGDPVGVVRLDDSDDPRSVAARVERILRLPNDVPITAVGAQTSVAGQAISAGGLVVDMSGLTSLEVHASAATPHATVGPGLVLDELNSRIRECTDRSMAGLQFEHTLDLSSSHLATIGGALMNNGGGILSTKYGSACDNVYDLEVMVPGRGAVWTSRMKESRTFADIVEEVYAALIDAGPDIVLDSYPRVKKNASGYNLRPLARQAKSGENIDLTQLFIGSEGTLGLLLRAKIRIVPYRRPGITSLAFFGSVDQAVSAVADVMSIVVEGEPVIPSALEIVDGSIFDVIDDLDLEIPDECVPPGSARAAVLLIEFDDSTDVVESVNEQLKARLSKYEVSASGERRAHIRHVVDSSHRERFWYLRRHIVKILNDYGSKYDLIAPPLIEDIGVPIEQLGRTVDFVARRLEYYEMKAAMFGHAGDGNLHIRPLIGRDKDSVTRARMLMNDVYQEVVAVGGTLTAEHGDGRLRTPYLDMEFGSSTTAVFRRIKEAFDPSYRLNPGVIVPNGDDVGLGPEDWMLDRYLPTGRAWAPTDNQDRIRG